MTDQELQKKYPAYSKSIFADFKPDNEEVLGWKQNVLQKVKGNSILPHYIEKGKDFDVFWGWITHFFAIIVYFCRNFKKFFINYEEYLNEIGEFMREKDYIQDSRVKINKDLKITLSEVIYHKIFCGYKLVNGIMTKNDSYYTTDFLSITNGTVIILKVLGYNVSLNEFQGRVINNVDVSLYNKNKELIYSLNTFNISSFDSKNGYRLIIPAKNRTPIIKDDCYFIKISYPRLGNSSLPLYLGVFLEGVGTLFETDRTEKEIFNVYSDFRKRGTFKSASLIKKILESKKEDNFYANYLPQQNSGWFLNKTCPTFQRLSEKVSIDSFSISSISRSSGSIFLNLKEQYVLLNQNTSIIVRGIGGSAGLVKLTLSIYDKDKNLLGDTPILGNWVYNSTNKTISPSAVNTISLIPKYNSSKNEFEAELPINIINTSDEAIFSTDTYDKSNLLNNIKSIYLFTKFNNQKTKEAYYLRVTRVELVGSDGYNLLDENDYNLLDENNKNLRSIKQISSTNDAISLEISLCLRKLPITFGFLNMQQYYLCCLKNNGSYSNSEVKELISQKVIPYNGYRLFVDNSLYKNDIIIPLNLENIYFDKISKKIKLQIKGGIPPYSYKFDSNSEVVSYLQNYETNSNYGIHTIKVTDALGKILLEKVSCQPFNDINYKFRLYVSKDNSIQIFIKLLGGRTETSYNISKYSYNYPYLYDNGDNQLLDKSNNELLTTEITESTGNAKKIVPANIWVDITDILGNNFSQITSNITLYIRDNGIPRTETSWLLGYYNDNDLELNIQDLFKDFALDFYDNGKGELLN